MRPGSVGGGIAPDVENIIRKVPSMFADLQTSMRELQENMARVSLAQGTGGSSDPIMAVRLAVDMVKKRADATAEQRVRPRIYFPSI